MHYNEALHWLFFLKLSKLVQDFLWQRGPGHPLGSSLAILDEPTGQQSLDDIQPDLFVCDIRRQHQEGFMRQFKPRLVSSWISMGNLRKPLVESYW